jgi:TRAP transporter TAXI family solute receptor
MRLAVVAALVPVLVGGSADAQDLRLFTVGSGDLGGGYYAAAKAICAVVNRANRGHLRCSPEPTAGSLYNLAMLREGQLDFAFAQSDWQHAALEGTGPFAAGGPMSGLRSVMALYAETITVLARPGAGIADFDDLLGKRIDIGLPGSGRNASIMRLLEELGLGPADFSAIEELPTDSAFPEICGGRLDATILIIGHPNDGIGRLIEDCGAILVPVDGPRIFGALADLGELAPAVIPAGTYPDLAVDVPTYATTATVVTEAAADAGIVEALVEATLDALPELKVQGAGAARSRSGGDGPPGPGGAAASRCREGLRRLPRPIEGENRLLRTVVRP